VNPDLPPDDLDLDNPYAPPRSTLLPEAAPQEFGGIPFTVSDVFHWSWAIFKERPWMCLALFWAEIAINWALAICLTMLEERVMAARPDRSTYFLITIVDRLIAIVLQAWLGIGMNRGLIKIARHEPVSFDILFSGGRSVVRVILAAIVVGVIIFLPTAVVAAALFPIVAAARGVVSATILLLFLACGVFSVGLMLYLTARLMQFYYLVIDRHAGILESIQWSWQLTRGRASTIILVYLLQICVALAGLLACCIGVIVAWPVSSMLVVVTYLALSELPKPVEQPPPIVWAEDI
jgi:hypothetical protein